MADVTELLIGTSPLAMMSVTDDPAVQEALRLLIASLDERGFVVDFGGLGFLKTWIADHLDHACLFAKADPIREQLLKDYPKLFRPLVIDSVSTEGIAQFVADTETLEQLIRTLQA